MVGRLERKNPTLPRVKGAFGFTLRRVQSLRPGGQEAGHGPLDHLPGLNVHSVGVVARVAGRNWPPRPHAGHLHVTPTHAIILARGQGGRAARGDARRADTAAPCFTARSLFAQRLTGSEQVNKQQARRASAPSWTHLCLDG